MTDLRLLSVCLAQPQKRGKTRTGIGKAPVAHPVSVSDLGLEGDFIGNSKYHGGPDQAVYLYSAEDYAWWEAELGQSLAHGTFGENLTISSFGPQPSRVGDILRVGPVILQLTAHRTPCSTLADHMGDPGFVKKFARVNRGGAYARVLEPGTLQGGESVTVERAPATAPTIDDLFALWHSRKKDPEFMRNALEAPLAERARRSLEEWLAKACKA